MVERINWPNDQDVKSNWWSANNVGDEPKKAPAGTRQTMIVEGIGACKQFFAIRSLDAASRHSAISNMAEATIP